MRKAMVASALLHFGLIAGAWVALSLPPAVDESDAESVSVSIISMDMVSTDPSEVVTQTDQNLVSAGEQHEAMEVPEASDAEPVTKQTVETAEAVEVETPKPVEQAAATPVPTETMTEVAETEDLVSAEVLTAIADNPHPVEAVVPAVTSAAATTVVETVKPAPSASDPLEQLRTASISELTPDAPAQKLPAALVKPVEAVTPSQTANLDQVVEQVEETAETMPVPLPPIKRKSVETAEPAKPQDQPAEQPKKKTEPPKKQAEPKQQKPSKQANLGNGGAAQFDTTASSKTGGGQGKKNDGGNAAKSKYEGQVRAKVLRAIKKVEAGRGGNGILGFTLGPSGSVLNVSVLDSSGDPAVDAAAVAAVKRGAPYPPIPPATGETSWYFGLPFGDE